MSNKTTAIILAAGLGKRMNDPETPKVLFTLLSKPLLGYVVDVVENLNNSGIEVSESIYIIGHHREKVKNFVKNYYNSNNITHNFDFAVQEEQLGTGHAVNQAKDTVKNSDENILILCGDVPFLTADTISRFITTHHNERRDISVLSTYTDNPKGYGRIVRDENGNFIKITEEKDANENEKLINEVNSGIYYLKAKLLFDLLKDVKSNNAQNEYYLTDIISIGLSQNLGIVALPLAKFNELQGINTQEELQKAEELIKK